MVRKQGRVVTQSQRRAKLVFQGGITVRTSGGVVRSAASHGLDFEHHLRGASNACKFLVRNKNVSISKRLAYLAPMVPQVACFAGGHRKIYKQDLRKLDIKFRKLVRTIVGPPGGSNWFVPWHDVPHEWNAGILDVKLYTLPSFPTNR